MNAEVKKKWLHDLRSGEFTQGYSYLKRRDGESYKHCCLGVLAEQAVAAGVCKKAEGWSLVYFDGSSGLLSASIRKWAEITDTSGAPVLYYNGEPRDITALNDCEKLSYLEIADLIEEYL